MTMDRARRALLLVVLAAAAVRMVRLAAWPMFIDEAVHLFWSCRLVREGWFVRPLGDGKPLPIALMAAVVPFSADPLWAGRMVSVLAGAVGLWAAGAAGLRLLGPRAGLMGAVLLAACPFSFVYDRFALADTYLAAAAALTLLATVALAEAPGPGAGLRAALSVTVGVLSKVPGLMLAGVPLLGVALLAPRRREAWRAAVVALLLIAVLTAFPVAWFVRHTGQIGDKTLGPEDAVAPQGLFLENLGHAAGWLWTYWTPPVVLAGAAGAVLALAGRRRPWLLLLGTSAGPVLLFALTAFYWFPRYVLLSTAPFVLLAAAALDWLAGRAAPRLGPRRADALALALTLAAAAPGLAFELALLRDPARAPLPEVERFQYVEGWPSGYGADQVVAEALAEPRRPLRVAVDQAGHSTLFYVVRTALVNAPGVQVVSTNLGAPATAETLQRWAGEGPVLVVLSPRREGVAPPGLPLAGARPLRKPGGTLAGSLARVPSP